MELINRNLAKGATWMVVFKLAERSLGLVSTIILARLLLPSDFGLIAMAMSIIAILELLNQFSFDMALIQNQRAERKQYDTAWTFNVLFGVASALILFLIANVSAQFYNEPRLNIVIYALALGSLIGGLENIGTVEFRKNMEFNKEVNFLLSKKLISFLTTVPAAILLRNYWALVIGILAGRVGGLVLSYVMHPYRPRFSLAARHELFHFSKWLFANNVLLFLRTRSADFIIGRVLGTQSLGTFSVAFEIANLPTTELIAPINRAIYPGYAKMSSDLAVLRQGFLNIISAIALFAIPAGAGIAATADLLVPVLLGNNWLETIPLIQILAFYGVLLALQTNTVYVMMAMGKPQIHTYIQIVYIAILIPLLIYFTMSSGAVGASWAYVGSTIAFFPIQFAVIVRMLNLKTQKLIAVFWRPLIATAVMLFTVRLLIENMPQPEGISVEIIHLILVIFVGIVTYTISVLFLWKITNAPEGAETAIIGLLKQRIMKLSPSFFSSR